VEVTKSKDEPTHSQLLKLVHFNRDFIELVVAKIELGQVCGILALVNSVEKIKEFQKESSTGELSDLRRQKSKHVVAEIQNLKLPQLPDALGKSFKLVVVQAQLFEVGEFPNILGQDEEVVVAGIKLHQHGQVENILNQSLNRVDPGRRSREIDTLFVVISEKKKKVAKACAYEMLNFSSFLRFLMLGGME